MPDTATLLAEEIKARRKLRTAQQTAHTGEAYAKEMATRNELRGRRAIIAQAHRVADFVEHPAVEG